MVRIYGDRKRLRRLKEDAEYFITRHTVNDMPLDPMRRGLDSSDVVLAFPFKDGTPAFWPQKAYAFLPIRESGFRFLLQADFVLTANRQDIESSSAWNERLLEALGHCFLKAVDRFNRPSAKYLRYSWCGFLQTPPAVGVNDFAPLFGNIVSLLKTHEVLECQDGSLQIPHGAVFVPSIYRDENGKFLLLDYASGFSYISNEYEKYDPELSVLERLGVEVMEPKRFISLLKAWLDNDPKGFSQKPADWHDALARTLFEVAEPAQLRDVAMIPLRDGRWVRISEGLCYFEDGNAKLTAQLPEGIDDLLLVCKDAAQSEPRRKLLTRLGVKELNQLEVCRLIITLHDSDKAPSVSSSALLGQACYLFDVSRNGISATKPSKFWMNDINGQPRLSHGLYLDSGTSPQLGDLLPTNIWGSVLMHSAYPLQYKGKLFDKWVAWLEKHLGVRTVVRIMTADSSNFSPEFQFLAENATTPALLDVLIASWLKDPSGFALERIRQKLGSILVSCEINDVLTKVKLSQGCLPTVPKGRKVPGLPILKLNNPENQKWNTLAQIGVIVKPDLTFYLRWLDNSRCLQVDHKQMRELYRNIELHVLSDPIRVRKYFHDHAAIFIPKTKSWARKTECVWKPTPGVKDEQPLFLYYPELQSFFFDHLQIQTATIDKVIKELREMAPPKPDNPSLRKMLLTSLNAFLFKKPDLYNKLRGGNGLENIQAIPVLDKHGFPRLISLNNPSWVFCDRHDLHDAFKGLNGINLADFAVLEFSKIQSLCTAIRQAWPGQERRMSALVTEEKETGSCSVFNVSMTIFLRRKMGYLRRLVRASRGSANADTRHLMNALHHIKVFHAPNMVIRKILHRRQIGPNIEGRPAKTKVLHKFVDNELRLYVSQDRISTPLYSPLSDVIIRACSIGQERLQKLVMDVILCDDERELHDLLHKADIASYDEETYQPLAVFSENLTAAPLSQSFASLASFDKHVLSGNQSSPKSREQISSRKETGSITGPISLYPIENTVKPDTFITSTTDGIPRHVDDPSKVRPEHVHNPTKNTVENFLCGKAKSATIIADAPVDVVNAVTRDNAQDGSELSCEAGNTQTIYLEMGFKPTTNPVSPAIDVTPVTSSSPRYCEIITKPVDLAHAPKADFLKENIPSIASIPERPVLSKGKANGKIKLNLRELMSENTTKLEVSQISKLATTLSRVKIRSVRSENLHEISQSLEVNGDNRTITSHHAGKFSNRRHAPEKEETVFPTIDNDDSVRAAGRTAYHKSEKDLLRERQIGVVGELFVWHMLKGLLGNVLPTTCWTSELRVSAGDEFDIWTPEDSAAFYCDFTVTDPEGKLGAYFSSQHEIILSDNEPAVPYRTFHIEVKSTANGRQEPFHLSYNQMAQCKKLAGNTTDVFVILRVYNLRSATAASCAVYVDPAKMIEDGTLVAQPKEYLVHELVSPRRSDEESNFDRDSNLE